MWLWGDDFGFGSGSHVTLCPLGGDREVENLAGLDLWALWQVSIHLVVYLESLCIQWERFGPN